LHFKSKNMPTNNQLARVGRKPRRYKNRLRALRQCPQKKGPVFQKFQNVAA